MALKFGERLRHAWNVFKNRDPTIEWKDVGIGSYYRQDAIRIRSGGEKTIINSIYNRIATDAATIHIQHARLDENGRFVETIKSGLNECLTVEANIDQSSRAFIQDAVLSMLDEGVVALVPIETTVDPEFTQSYEIHTMRVGRIVEWYPKHIKVNLYNEATGLRQDVTVAKRTVAIVENPFYSIMNDYNSTLQRLIRKLALLDAIDEENSSAKMNLIIQLPYAIKTELQKRQAETRRKAIEEQLNNSKYGIAYSDATEKIVQLNRPLENNLLSQIEYLTKTALSQLGMDESILNCTASEATMLRYYDGIVEPIVAALCDNMSRNFISKTARTQNQKVIYYRDPFKLVPVSDLAAIANALTRNEILTSNEIRSLIGMKPSKEPSADELRNKNLYPENGIGVDGESGIMVEGELPEPGSDEWNDMVDSMSEEEYLEFVNNYDEIDEMLDDLEGELNGPAVHGALGEFTYDPSDTESKYNHEYYEAHKQLKGKRSTAGLNELGKEKAWLAKERFKDEKKYAIDTEKERTNNAVSLHVEERKNIVANNNESRKQLLAQKQQEVKNKIENIRTILKRMSPKRRKFEKDNMQAEIDRLRDENTKQKDSITSRYRDLNSQIATRTKDVNSKLKTAFNEFRKEMTEKYNNMYEEELERIKSDPMFQKIAKGSSKKNSSKKETNRTTYKSKEKNTDYIEKWREKKKQKAETQRKREERLNKKNNS